MGGAAIERSGAAAPPAALAERLRGVHLAMVEAVLAGEGLDRVAEIAGASVGGRVEIVVGSPAPVPRGATAVAPIVSGGEPLGLVALVGPSAAPSEARWFLHLAAVASLTEVALGQAGGGAAPTLRGSLLEDLREGRARDAQDVVRRAARMGCDLTHGAVAVAAELGAERPRHVAASVAGDHPGVLAEASGRRVLALLPAGEDGPRAAVIAARRLAGRLQRYGPAGVSGFCARAGQLWRALEEAELLVELRCRRPPAGDAQLPPGGPRELEAFLELTVGPLRRHDEQYRTELVRTLRAFLDQAGDVEATAAALRTHAHTVAYRMERVVELTRLDARSAQDAERLALGLRALRALAPRLPR